MGRLLLGLAVLMLAAGCARPAAPAAPQPAAGAAAQARSVDPERVKRVRADLPPGYEVGDVDDGASIAGFWGFRPGWTAEPAQCGALVDPVAASRSVRGLSGSGPGGIVYVVVVTAQTGAVPLDPALIGECGDWTMTFGRSSAAVSFVPAPHLDGSDTVGMSTAIRTVVESGTETDSQAQTFSAYLGEHFVFVTLVTDPGSPDPPLPPEFAADLLVKTVAALRG